MSDLTLHELRRGDKRLMLACVVLERLCAERLPASVRLEAELALLPRSVIPLAWRLTTGASGDRNPNDAAPAVAAA